MKGIFTAIIFFGVLVILSVQTFAQSNGSPNGAGNGSANGLPNGASPSNSNQIRSATQAPVLVVTTPIANQKVKFVGPADDHRTTDNGVFKRHDNGVDAFAYDQTALSSIARICLVPGARRCVQ